MWYCDNECWQGHTEGLVYTLYNSVPSVILSLFCFRRKSFSKLVICWQSLADPHITSYGSWKIREGPRIHCWTSVPKDLSRTQGSGLCATKATHGFRDESGNRRVRDPSGAFLGPTSVRGHWGIIGSMNRPTSAIFFNFGFGSASAKNFKICRSFSQKLCQLFENKMFQFIN